jgi:hypothetical protein
MPNAKPRSKINFDAILQDFLALLTARGPLSSGDACGALKISQPTFSRMLSKNPGEFATIGAGRSLRYLARRTIERVLSPVPIFEVKPDGRCIHIADLEPTKPIGFVVRRLKEGEDSEVKLIWFKDMPYFLEEMRPQGFLGRRIPSNYPDLQAPPDIRLWSGDHVLGFITLYGSNLVGNLVVGEAAFRGIQRDSSTDESYKVDRGSYYENLALKVLGSGEGGSSAAGEQPKFLLSAGEGEKVEHLLVKFSPPVAEPLGQRVSDLLFCEHLALEVLRENGEMHAVQTRMVEGEKRTFLEVVRFDRVGQNGRRGFLSLSTIDAEFAAVAGSWSETALVLCKKNLVEEATRFRIEKLDLFGALIANTDRHNGNLAVWYSTFQKSPFELAPVYDMLPMYYMPRQNQIVEQAYVFPQPAPNEVAKWSWALPLAENFWRRVSVHQMISAAFKDIAEKNLSDLIQLKVRLESLR